MQPLFVFKQIIDGHGAILLWPADRKPPEGWQFFKSPETPWQPCNDCPGLGHCAQAGGCLRDV